MLDNFFILGPVPADAVQGTFNPLLVLISFLIASFGSYAGLNLAIKLLHAQSLREKRALHMAGALALGAGIWSMHFTGMLAYKMRMAMEYDLWLTVLSMVIAVTVAYFVLLLVQTDRLSWRRIVIGAILLGFGICAMHYTGMAALQMRATLRYVPSLFILSVVIAITASGAALCIMFVLGRRSIRWWGMKKNVFAAAWTII